MTTHTSEIIAKDHDLQGLSLLFKAEQVAHALTSANQLTTNESIELEYIRYKPGRRALGLFNAVKADGSRLPFVVYAYDSSGWEKFLRTGHTKEVLRQNGLVLPDCRAAIEWFPFDRRLKQLAKLTDPNRNEKIFRRLLESDSIECQLSDGLAWKLEPLTYKPARRFVAKASRGPRAFAVKCYTRDDFESAQSRSEAVNHAELAHLVSRSIASSSHYSIIASDWLDGHTLSESLSNQYNSQAILMLTGKLLYQWQTIASKHLSQISSRHGGFTFRSLQTVVDDVTWLLPDMRHELDLVLNELAEPLATMQVANDLIHGDFYAKQILVNQDELRLIDFDEIGRGHRYQDLGNFVGHLYWDVIRDGELTSEVESRLKNSTDSLIRGYATLAGTMDIRLVHASIAVGMMHCLAHAFRRGLPDWPNKTKQLLACARQFSSASKGKPASYRSVNSNTRLRLVTSPVTSQQRMNEFVAGSAAEHDECLPYLEVSTINVAWRKASERLSPPWNDTFMEWARLIRHKPGKRLLVEYAFASADRSRFRAIGKARIGKRIDPELLKLHKELQSLRCARVVVPRVIGQIPSIHLWLQEKIFGRHVLSDSNPADHRAVGAALAELHLSGVTSKSSHTPTDELRILHQQYERWLMSSDRWRAPAWSLLQLAEQAISKLKAVGNVLVHRDFYFDQILLTEGAVALLDFDLACMGPAELDVGNYLAHLHEYDMRSGFDETSHKSADAFVDGYLAVRTDLNLADVEIWHNLSLARLAAISQRIPSRSSTTQRLLEECAARFNSPHALFA